VTKSLYDGIHDQRQREFCSATAEISERWIEPGQLVLDVGCGEGDIAQFCGNRKDAVFVGVELSAARIREAHQKGLQITCSDAMNLPFKRAVFGVAMSHLLLECVPNPYRVLEEIRRTLRSDGSLILSVPNHSNLYEVIQSLFKPDQYSDYLVRYRNLFGYTAPYLFVMLKRTGYSVEQVVKFVGSLRLSDAGLFVRLGKWIARKMQTVTKLPLALSETIIVKAVLSCRES